MTDQLQQLYDEASERALVGAALLEPALLDTLNIAPDDFYIHRHRAIFTAARRLMSKGVEPDAVTLCDMLERDQQLEQVGGLSYVTELLYSTPTSYGAEGYARIVRDYARRRAVGAVANQLAGLAYDTGRRLDEGLAPLIDALGKSAVPDRAARAFAAWAVEAMTEVERRRANPTDIPGIPTGFLDLDAYLGGLKTGQVFYMAGEPAVGKSKLMLNIATNAARAGHGVAVFSLEMSGFQIATRALSAMARVPTRNMQTGKLTEAEYQALKDAAQLAETLPLYVNDDPTLTIPAMRADLARLKARYGVELFVVDYLLLLNGYPNMKEDERSALLSRGVRQIARDLDMAGISVNSVTKDGMDSKGTLPSNKNVRGSGQVVHDADLIAFLIENATQPEFVSLVFTKLRDVASSGARVELYRHATYPLFSDATRSALP